MSDKLEIWIVGCLHLEEMEIGTKFYCACPECLGSEKQEAFYKVNNITIKNEGGVEHILNYDICGFIPH